MGRIVKAFLLQCQWARLKSGKDLLPGEEKLSASVRDFLSHHYKERPKERLCPRVSLRGGKVECYSVMYTASDGTERLIHIDYNSL